MTMAWLFSDEANSATDALRKSLLKDYAIAPVLWPIEVGNVLLVATRRGRITSDDWSSIRTDLAALPIEVEQASDDRVLESVVPIAHQYEISVYDAMYLEIALRLGLPLATLDRKLAAASSRAGVVVVAGR